MSELRGMRLTKPPFPGRGAELNEIRLPRSTDARFVAARERAEIEETRGLQYQELRANAVGTATKIAAAKRAEFLTVMGTGSDADELSAATVQASMKARAVAARGLSRAGVLKAKHSLELQHACGFRSAIRLAQADAAAGGGQARPTRGGCGLSRVSR